MMINGVNTMTTKLFAFVVKKEAYDLSKLFQSIIFPSMTVCDSNGFKSREIMEKFNMTKFVLLRGIEKWPRYVNLPCNFT